MAQLNDLDGSSRAYTTSSLSDGDYGKPKKKSDAGFTRLCLHTDTSYCAMVVNASSARYELSLSPSMAQRYVQILSPLPLMLKSSTRC